VISIQFTYNLHVLLTVIGAEMVMKIYVCIVQDIFSYMVLCTHGSLPHSFACRLWI